MSKRFNPCADCDGLPCQREIGCDYDEAVDGNGSLRGELAEAVRLLREMDEESQSAKWHPELAAFLERHEVTT